MKLLISRHGLCLKYVNINGYPEILGGSYGDLDRDLQPEGFHQAKGLGCALQQHDIAAAYSSALLRSIHTAETALQVYTQAHHPLPLLHQDPRLNERDFGHLSGWKCDEMLLRDDVLRHLDRSAIQNFLGIEDTFSSTKEYLEHILYSSKPNVTAVNIINLNSYFHPDLDVETTSKMSDRLDEFEEHVLKTHPKDSTIAVFTHGDVMKVWMQRVMDHPDRYTDQTLETISQIPSKGLFRKVDNCALYEISLR